MHHFLRAADVKPTPAFPKHSKGYRRFSLSDRTIGAVHSGWGLCELDTLGHLDLQMLSFEKSFYVLAGNPVLVLDGRATRLSPGSCGLIPVGMQHAWLGPDDGTARWIDMCAPCPKGEHFATDTYFLGPPPKLEVTDLDIRDPSLRHFFRMADDDIRVDAVRTGLKKDAPKVSASMATALLVYSGISLKMLVDQRLDAALHTMFMVEYEPNANAHPHDHPLEEAYFIMHGEVEAWADDEKYLMKPGDFLWAGVGCTHAFYNRGSGTVRWLETQSPQPPARNSYRWARDWEYVAENLQQEGPAGAHTGKKAAV
jgi:mannose-6-phosphate isomerase-like protein (cupin superfamily)